MNIFAHGRNTDSDATADSGLPNILCIFLCVLFALFSQGLFAQTLNEDASAAIEDDQLTDQQQETEEIPEEIVKVTVTLPDSHQMTLALVSQELRQKALLDLVVAANVLTKVNNGTAVDIEVEVDHATLVQGFLDDRAWLQMLVNRYGWEPPRSSVLDPAAWLVMAELQQHDLEDVSQVFPGRTTRDMLNNRVFQRVAERVAVANLPGLLLEVESDAVNIWKQFYALTGSEMEADAAWKEVETTWFSEVQFPPPLDPDLEELVPHREKLDIAAAMSRIAKTVVDTGPPDDRGLRDLRYSMLHYVSQPDDAENVVDRGQIRNSLYLLSVVSGLYEARYFDFVQGVLSITSSLLENSTSASETPLMVEWLLKELPPISAHYAVDFARVDPRLNAALAAAFEVLQKISSFDQFYALEEVTTETIDESPIESEVTDPVVAEDDTQGIQIDDALVVGVEISEPRVDAVSSAILQEVKASRALLADAVAQLALMIPDMGYYFDTPVRRRIVEEIDICISIAASRDDAGGTAMVRRQFDACMETLLQLADQETRTAELSGNINGPFTADALRRELNVTPWQRINYGIGYLQERYSSDCQAPAKPLPNPLEWAVLATTMTWFAEKSPEFIRTPENEARVTKMRDIGEQLIQELAAQSECLAGSGTIVTDPVFRGLTNYELALRELNQGIKKAMVDFRTEKLSPGADVLLEEDATQNTSYRPENLVIAPCEQRETCEMSGNLSTTRALIGLFPNEYLIAEQTGMGSIDICYRNMEWVDRRSELVRADDENVSNYYGHLGFDLVGTYTENDQSQDIFAFRFTSPQEHHYLFAQTSEEVLADSCPVEWVGSRVVTPLREDRGGIVPNRLTYLAASRTLPSRLLQNNWDRGAEWRDWFVTGIGVNSLEVPALQGIGMQLNQHLQSLYQAEQAGIYQRLFLPETRNSEGENVSLFAEMSQVSIAKALIRMQMILFYPDSLFNSDSIRTSIAGDAGLLDSRTLRRFRESNVPLASVNATAMERLNTLRSVWLEQTEAVRRKGSIPASLMHAMTRIHVLYRQFFAARPEPLQEIEVTAEPIAVALPQEQGN